MSRPSLAILDGGLQTTIQAGPRRGLRHLGVPSCGAADPVSLALANRLVGNSWDAPGLEVTLTGAAFRALTDLTIAVAGAPCEVVTDEATRVHHEAFTLRPGALLRLGSATAGCRTYLALAGGVAAEALLGSVSTYLPAGLGGLEGRALREGDVLSVEDSAPPAGQIATPDALRQPFGRTWTLRAVLGPESDALNDAGSVVLFGEDWRADPASNRMGVRLKGPALSPSGGGRMDSAAALPGTVQLPPGGAPIILGVDGGTTGGYPRVAQVIRADRHLIGQIRPGAPVRLLRWSAEDADAVLAEKTMLLRRWVGDKFRL